MKAYKINQVKNIRYIGADTAAKDEIPLSYFNKKQDVLIKTTGHTFKNSYKLLVDGQVKVAGRRKRIKRQFEFAAGFSLLTAIAKCQAEYLQLSEDAKEALRDTSVEDDQELLNTMPTFKQAFDSYISAKITRYRANNKKISVKNVRGVPTEFGSDILFCNKHLKPLFNIPLDEIKKTHLEKIMANMKNSKGEPLALRTKRGVYQQVNPVYTYILDSTDHVVKSPASMRGLGKLHNEKQVDLSEEETRDFFRSLVSYHHPVARGVFIFMLHGHRVGEIVTLKWSDVDIASGTYTVRAENTKARIDMTYSITKRLKSLFDEIGVRKDGYIFPSMNNDNEPLSSSTLRGHWKHNTTLHDTRHIIGGYLVNRGVSLEIIGSILGHTPVTGNITSRYAKVNYETSGAVVDAMFDDLLDD